MEHSKQLITVLIAFFIAVCPLMAYCDFSYADDSTWTQCETKEEVVAAWKAYLVNRNVSYIGNPTSALVSWSYEQIANACRDEGYELSDLQAGLWYQFNQESGIVGKYLKFRYSTSAISILNAIFAKFAIQNGLNSDTFNQTLYSGESFTDLDGNSCLVYYFSKNNFLGETTNYITKYGTPYKYSGESLYLMDISNETFRFTQETSDTVSFTRSDQSTSTTTNLICEMYDNKNTATIYSYFDNESYNTSTIVGCPCIIKYNNEYYFGYAYERKRITKSTGNTVVYYSGKCFKKIESANTNQAAISAASDGLKGAMEALGEYNAIEIGKDGLTAGYDNIKDFLDDDDPQVKDDQDPPQQDPLPPDGTGPSNQPNLPTGVNIDNNGNINFQMPDLNVDWNLNIGNNPPFPFSIPFDIINFMQAFNTEPVTPHIEETINIANMDIDIDIDLEWLDDVAGYFRTFILLSYTIGLIVATRALFHIY